MKNGVKVGFKQEVTHIGDMVKEAGKISFMRLKSAKAAVNNRSNVMLNKAAKGTIKAGRVVDTGATFAKNLIPSRKRLVETSTGLKVYMPAENTHAVENKLRGMYNKIGVNLEGGITKGVRKTGVGKTGEGIPLEEVKPDVLKQIYPHNNGAYGYLPNGGTAYHKPEYDFTNVEWAKEMQKIRIDYLEASKQLESDIERMTAKGFSKEDIAKHVVEVRNQQKVTARANMTLEEREGLEARNMEIYGNQIGPDAQWLYNKTKKQLIKKGTFESDGQVWNIIIEKSMKKDDVINTLLGLIH